MYNNFTDNCDTYQPCTVILTPNDARGGLLIGDFNSATSPQLIQKHNIKTIITAAVGLQHLEIPKFINHIVYPLLDSPSENIKKFFDASTQTIALNLKKGSVLVHCAAGISRSTTLVLAYIMKTTGVGFKQAISMVRSKRKNVCPNLGFERQLKKYQIELKESKVSLKGSLKKTVSEKLSEEIRTSYNSQHSSNHNYFKFEPRTAAHSVRKKGQMNRKLAIVNSHQKYREKKNFHIRALGADKDNLMVFGQNNKMGGSEKINPPLIQKIQPKAINPNWSKLRRLPYA